MRRDLCVTEEYNMEIRARKTRKLNKVARWHTQASIFNSVQRTVSLYTP